MAEVGERGPALLRRRGAVRVRVSSEGIAVEQGRREHFVPWDRVAELWGQKFDAWFVDTICIHVVLRDGAGVLVISEDDAGYLDLRREVERRFGIPTAWLDELASGPAFVEKERRLHPPLPEG